jgi:hypothetical protein
MKNTVHYNTVTHNPSTAIKAVIDTHSMVEDLYFEDAVCPGKSWHISQKPKVCLMLRHLGMHTHTHVCGRACVCVCVWGGVFVGL